MASTEDTKMAMPLFSIIMIIIFLNITQLAGLAIASEGFESSDNVTETARQSDATVRVDPLDNLNKYRGGYDITNKHYWSSTVFTGIYGYAIAIIWLLCSLGYGGFLLAKAFCCNNRRKLKKKKTTCGRHEQHWTVISATFFTILAIGACGVVLGGNTKFHSRAKTVVDILIDTADNASDTIDNTTGAMRDMSSNLGGVSASASASASASDFLITTSQRLHTQAADIRRQASKHRHAIDKGLNIVNIITTVTISLTLVTAIALSVLGVLKLQKALRLFIVFCCVLTFLCWLFFGIYFFIHNFVGDTCTAFEGFQQDPYNNSLSSILPCDELLSAKSVLYDVSEGIFNIVNQVNRNISTSYGNIVQICNPFSGPPEYEYQSENCPANTIRIGDIPQVLRLLTCTDSEGGTCNGGILISTSDFNTVVAYTTSIQNLLNVFPGMESLVECQTVREAFAEILQNHCKPLKRYVHMEWAAMVVLAVVMVTLVLTWTIESHHEQNHHSLGGSVKPHSPAAETLESGTANTIKNDSTPTFIL